MINLLLSLFNCCKKKKISDDMLIYDLDKFKAEYYRNLEENTKMFMDEIEKNKKD
jgi:hypothetical protein